VQRSRLVSAITAAMILLAACSGAMGSDTTTPDDSTATSEQSVPPTTTQDVSSEACIGPMGDASVPAADVQLSDEEIAEIQSGGYTAAVTWAGSGPWYDAADAGFNDALTEFEIERVASASAEYDPAKQATDVESAMALDPDVVLGSPVDALAAAEAYRPVVEAGKVLVLSDNVPEGYEAGADYVGLITGNRCESGKIMAELMSEAIGGSGQIGMIFFEADFYVTNVLDDSFRNSISENYPEIEIAVESGFAEEPATQEIASAMILQNPDIEGIYVTWSVAAQGVIEALREAGREDIQVISHDLDSANDLVIAQEGVLYGVATEVVHDIGYRLGHLAGYGLLGKEAPPYATVEMIRVTKGNLAEAWQQALNTEPPPEVQQALGG